MRLKYTLVLAVNAMLLVSGCSGLNVFQAKLIQQDTTDFNSSHQGLVAITIANTQSVLAHISIPATGTNQYSIVADPADNPFYASQLSGAAYCHLTPEKNDAYMISLPAHQECDVLLRASQNNPPGSNQFNLNITISTGSGSALTLPVSVSLTNYLYAGGEFTQNAPDGTMNMTYNHLAKWDGSQWLPVTQEGVSDNVNVLAVNPLSGDLYAGGWFNQAGRLTVNHILEINRDGVSALGQGFDHAVNAIAFNTANDTILAGGNFSASGNISMHYLAAFNGSNWTNLDPLQILSGPVRAVSFDPDSGIIYIGGNFPIQNLRRDNLFGNKVYYPIYQYTHAVGLSILSYTNDRVDVFLPTPTDGLLIGGDFNQYTPILTKTVTNNSHLGIFLNGALIQLGASANQPLEAGDINRAVKSMALVANTLYISGYFQTAVTGETESSNPYGNNMIVAACNLTTKTCSNIGSPNANTYWVYQLVADNNGRLYGLSEEDNTLDAGQGPDYPYVYNSSTHTWTRLGTTGFNFLAYTEALGSTIKINVP